MKNKFKKILIIIFPIILLVGIGTYIIVYSQYSYEWKEEKDSTIGQYRLYVKNGFGKYIDGKVDITYLNDKTETVKIKKNGVLYVKSIIKNVTNPKG